MQKNFDMLAATTLPMPAIKAGVPTRRPVDPFVCYAADGYVLALRELAENGRAPEGYAEQLAKIMPERFGVLLRNSEYQISDAFWLLIQGLSKEIHVWICHRIIWHVQVCEAFYLLECTPNGESPLAAFPDKWHWFLPIWLAGPERFNEIWGQLKPLLSRFGLDKWISRDFYGNVEIATVAKDFPTQRTNFIRLCGADTHLGMEKFLRNPGARIAKVPSLPSWPDELSVFRGKDDESTDKIILDAIGVIASHYY